MRSNSFWPATDANLARGSCLSSLSRFTSLFCQRWLGSEALIIVTAKMMPLALGNLAPL